MKNTKLPAWFKGSQYEKGSTVKNPFSGEEYELNPVELSMYDFIIGSQLVMEMQPKMVSTKMLEDFHKGLDWFKRNNANAYMVLLD
tara:strand:- start:206 stop:463 length:258 start_codon:yes stop_codon:yes gene_type:complete